MKPEEIREVFMRSAKDLLDYDEEGRGPANVAVRVESYELVGKNSILLSLEENIDDTLGAYLYVGDFLVLDKDVVSYSFYDRNTKTLGATIDNPGIIGMIAAEHPEMTVEFDLSFLIKNARDYYDEHGILIGYPDTCPCFPEEDIVFPAKFSPSDQQRNAVRTILNSKLSYVWGAPGTGKTQMVLATAIMAYMRRGKRVAIIAPTNNSVEQVLRGVLGVIGSDDGFRRTVDPAKDIARIGTATEQFVEDYPYLCEGQSISMLISKRRKEIKLLKEIIQERELDVIASHFRALEVLAKERKQPADRKAKRDMDDQIDQLISEINAVLEENSLYSDLARDLTSMNFEHQLEAATQRLYQRDRPKNSIP